VVPDEPRADALERVIRYHRRSKHHPDRYAPSPGFLDWVTEPDPCRRFGDSPLIELPLAAEGVSAAYDDLYRPGAVAARPLGLEGMGAFFELALGLSAWKELRGVRWALRSNPSSGNLHPTEGYALLPEAPGLTAGLYHYSALRHLLERRSTLPPRASSGLAELLPPSGFLVGLTSIHWREAWKYGERAFRYCEQDLGHALACVRYAAATLGWSVRLLPEPADDDLAGLLGLDREDDFPVHPADREHPAALLLVAPARIDLPSAARRVADALDELIGLVRQGTWAGRANALSADHHDWPAVAEVAAATRKPRTRDPVPSYEPLAALHSRGGAEAARLIRQRRSALDMDGTTAIGADVFYSMLDRLLPRPSVPPWDALPWSPRVHACLFVHRVTGLSPGLYLLERSAGVHESLRAALRPEFAWARAEGAPEHLRLFRLQAADLRSIARLSSCHQEMAADGVFSLGMLAELAPSLGWGPWWYRRLHWEAGVLGQVLYLEAEAAGTGSTGMGCFFDDVCPGVLGLGPDDGRLQDIYHFAVGKPVPDPRLTTLPPYGHLEPSRSSPGRARPHSAARWPTRQASCEP